MRPRLVGFLLAALAIVATGAHAQTPPAGPDRPLSGNERRTLMVRGDLLSLKAMLTLRADQQSAWDQFEAGIVKGNVDALGFTDRFCAISTARDIGGGALGMAKRLAALSRELSERAEALTRLDATIAPLRTSLTAEQRKSFDVLTGRLMGLIVTPPYGSPETGLPGVCTREPPRILPGPIVRPVPRQPPNSTPL